LDEVVDKEDLSSRAMEVATDLATEVVDKEDLSSRAMEVATDLATLGHPHYKITKELDQKDTLDKVLSAISGNS